MTRPADGLVEDILGQSPAHGGQVLTVESTQQRSTALAFGTHRISSTVDCWYKTGGAAVAAVAEEAGSAYLAAGVVDWVTVHDNSAESDCFLSVIDVDDAGTMSITQCRDA